MHRGGRLRYGLARTEQVKHAVAMGVLQVLMTIGVWMSLPGSAPAWRWLVAIALIVPAAWLGGRLRAGQP